MFTSDLEKVLTSDSANMFTLELKKFKKINLANKFCNEADL